MTEYWLAAGLLGGAAVLGTLGAAVSERLSVVNYTVRSRKIRGRVRLLILSDLHSSTFGKEQKKLFDAVESASPDAVLLCGDIVDDRVTDSAAWALLSFVGKRYPSFYVSGNHEIYTGRAEEIKREIRALGITVLEGEGRPFSVGDDLLTVCGIDDPFASPDGRGRMWEEQLRDCDRARSKGCFSVLLTHRPEPVGYYKETGFDLVVAGHAHGGQVRIPGLINGLYAPNQGIFPRYAGGRYDLSGEQTMIVSRGLSRYVRPRVFNRPEVVTVDLLPEIEEKNR